MKHIVEPLFVSHCILVQYCFLSFVSIILRHLCPVHQVRAQLAKIKLLTPRQYSNRFYITNVITSSEFRKKFMRQNMLLPISYELQWENLKTSARLFQVGINLYLGHPSPKTSLSSFYTLQ